jgi:NitT/TauT family transport system permease protein
MMRRSRFLSVVARIFAGILNIRASSRKLTVIPPKRDLDDRKLRLGDILWYALIALIGIVALWKAVWFVLEGIRPTEIGRVVAFGFVTLLRVGVLIALASLIWVPIGVFVGLRPHVARVVQPIAQFLAAFPAILFFPIVVSGIVLLRLNPDIWLSPLMILGTQWYILFNVIVGASAIPTDLRYVGENLRVRGWLWWKRVALPAVFPFYVTGAITASGGSWNASVVSEVALWGKEKLTAHGLGAYISEATNSGDFRRTVLGTVVMALFVVVLNRLFWRPLYARAERKFRL